MASGHSACDRLSTDRVRMHGPVLSITSAMNRFERRPTAAAEAELDYGHGEFRVVRPGAFVRCATTGIPIPLDDLRYWNVDRQEAYSTPDAKLAGLGVRPKT